MVPDYGFVSGKANEVRDLDKLRASAIEAATCDRFGNPVLSLGPKTTVGRALAAQEDFQRKRLPAFARFRDAERLSRSASQSPVRSSEEAPGPENIGTACRLRTCQQSLPCDDHSSYEIAASHMMYIFTCS